MSYYTKIMAHLIKILLVVGLVIPISALSQEKKAVKPAQASQEQKNENYNKKNIQQASRSPFILGAELRNYLYSEPGFVTHAGLLYGVWGEISFDTLLGQFGIDGNFLYGNINYDGALCDVSNNCTPYVSTTTDMITKINAKIERDLTDSILAYGGIGYRYLYDRGNGSGFYTRTGNWGYLPLGLKFKGNKLSSSIEFDAIIYGSFSSNLSEVSASYNDIVHTQRGYGIVTTISYNLNSQWLLSALYESWNLDESEPVASGGSKFVEPKNSATSISLRVGFQL